MSGISQDMQTNATVMDIFTMMLSALESIGRALEVMSYRSNETIDTMARSLQEESKVLKDFIKHMEKGNKVFSIEVLNSEHAKELSEMLRLNHVPFIQTQTQSGAIFMYKDIDEGRFMKVAEEAAKYVENKGHELGFEAFMERSEQLGQGYSKISGLSAEEIAVFRKEADKCGEAFTYTVKGSKDNTFDIYANNKVALERTVVDTLFTMGTPEGLQYAKNLVEHDNNQKAFVDKAKRLGDGIAPAYIINAKNPSQIIELSKGEYKYHSITVDENGKMIDIVSSNTRPIDKGLYQELKANWKEDSMPILLTPPEATAFIKGQTREGTIEFAPKFSGSPEKFIGLADVLQKDYARKSRIAPLKEPELELISMSQDFKEKALDMTVYTNIPLSTMIKVEKADIDGVYIYNKGNVREIACTPEATPQLSALLKENLAKGMGPLDTWLTMEKYKGHGERGDNKDEPYYIVDASFPDAVLEISPQDATYTDTEKRIEIKAPKGMSMDDAILAHVYEMSAPVVLSKDEFNLVQESWSSKQQLIESLFVNPMSTNVVKAEQERLDKERERLDSLIQSPEEIKQFKKDLTPAQQYVLKQREKRNLEAKEIKKDEKGKNFEPKREKPKDKSTDFER